MSVDHDEPGHGNSPAAWTSVTIMLIGFAIGTVAFFLELAWVVVASAVIVLIGLIIGIVLARMGYGVGGAKLTPKGE